MKTLTKAVAAGLFGLAVVAAVAGTISPAEAQQTVVIGSDRQTGGPTASDAATMQSILEGARRLRR